MLRGQGVALGALAIAFAINGLCDSSHAQTADSRFCSDTAPNVVAFLDVTTPYDEADKASLIEGISRIFEGLEDGSRFSIRTIENKSTSSDRLVDLCIPYCEIKGSRRSAFELHSRASSSTSGNIGVTRFRPR